jgi:putative transposase
MVRFAFRRGLRFLQQTKSYTLVKRLFNGKLQFEDAAGETVVLTEDEIYSKWQTGQWHIDEASLGIASSIFFTTTPKDLRAYSEEQQAEAKKKQGYLVSIRERFALQRSRFVSTPERLQPLIDAVAAEQSDSNPPTPSTIWRWWTVWSPTQCATRLITDRSRAGRRVDEVQRSVFDEAVAEVFLTKQKKPGKAVVDRVRSIVDEMNRNVPEADQVVAPSQATIYRWLNQLHYRLVSQAREGKVATERQLRSAMTGVRVTKILERVELDHTPLDIIVICKSTRLILGRPWLTVAICRHSRMVLGFYLSFHAPSATSVLCCLRQIIMPKTELLARFPSVQGPWPARGIPDALAVDNGMDLHAHAVDAVSVEMGIELLYMPSHMPWFKAAIERYLRTVSHDLIHTLPGTTFFNPEHRGDYPSEAEAALDLTALTEILLKWFVDYYNKRPHKGLAGRTPLQVWQDGEDQRRIELPAYPRQLELIIGHAASRSLFHYGIEYETLRYNSPLLQSLRDDRDGTQILKIRAFDEDVSRISVLHPQRGEYFDVPAVNLDYASGMNRHVHRLVCAEVRRRFSDEVTNERLRQVKAEIQAMVDAAIKDKKTANRKASARARALDSEAVFRGEAGADSLGRAMGADRGRRAAPKVVASDDGAVPSYPEACQSEGAAR